MIKILNKYLRSSNIIGFKLNKNIGAITDIAELYLKDDDTSNIMQDIRSSKNVVGAKLIYKKGKRMTVEVININCPIYTILTYDPTSFRRERFLPNGDIQVLLSTTKKRKLNKIIEKIKSESPSTHIKDIKIHKKRYPLSPIQEAIIRTAYDLGYYDYPKKVTLRELSKVLGLSTSTINETLRKAEKKILTYYFSERKIQPHEE